MIGSSTREIEGKKITLRVEYDGDCIPHPRKDFDNLGTMVCFHRQYNLGDEHDYSNLSELFENLTSDYINNENTSTKEIKKIIDEHFLILPIYGYEHTNLQIQTTPFNCTWDSGFLGYIYVDKKQIEDEGITIDDAKKILQAEVEVYNSFINDECYGFILSEVSVCECCNHEVTKEIDSCWGFLGSEGLEELRQEIPKEYRILFDDIIK